MPYSILHQGDCYKVTNTATGKIHAKCSTEAAAKAQVRLLRGLESGSLKPRKK